MSRGLLVPGGGCLVRHKESLEGTILYVDRNDDDNDDA